jgi:hypothetical protein
MLRSLTHEEIIVEVKRRLGRKGSGRFEKIYVRSCMN